MKEVEPWRILENEPQFVASPMLEKLKKAPEQIMAVVDANPQFSFEVKMQLISTNSQINWCIGFLEGISKHG